MSITDTDISTHTTLPLRAPDRMAYDDHPRLRALPKISFARMFKRLIAPLTLPEIMPAHPEAPEPIQTQTRSTVRIRL